jgi:integrase
MQTRCREVYTPISAVMHRAGDLRPIKRPKGSKSSKRVSWLRREQAFALFAAADAEDTEFGLLLRLFCYTGMRKSEVLRRIRVENVDLKNASIYVPKTKNTEPRQVHLTPELVAGLANLFAEYPERGPTDPVFRFRVNGYLQDKLARAMTRAGLAFPTGQNGFHLFRHTWAMWMRRYAGLDTSGLVETGAWRDRASAARYEHLDATEEAKKADLLPTMRSK